MAALLVSTVTLLLGYIGFGVVTMLIFTAGFIGGLVLWLVLPARGTWSDIKVPFVSCLVLFLLHRVEEKQFGFFAYLADVTGVPKPDVASFAVLALVGLSVGAWLVVPLLMKRASPFGRYLAWTFFASMGVTELAHFLVFPWLNDSTTSYVPGMWTVVVLAPVAWWGMSRLARGHRVPAGR
ncbi:HXXEE domain-containing protein [Mycobacterium sp. NPDC050041]|uniref:HXXEE domain-containing protein n=1 Tax=Mycobacterium sp. NPDC050041 TaxID=3364293 RepID=UPI003C2E7945